MARRRSASSTVEAFRKTILCSTRCMRMCWGVLCSCQAARSPGFAFLAAGAFKTIAEAQDKICPKHKVYEPQPDTQKVYGELYELYRKIYFAFGQPDGSTFGDVLPKLIQIA